MIRRSLTLLLLLQVFLLCSQAQSIIVKQFYHAASDLTASTPGTEVIDSNGKRCALIKVETTERGFTFDSGMLGVMKVEQQNSEHPAEIWVYVPEGVKRLTIQHPRFGVLRNKDLGLSVASSRTYIMQIATGHVSVLVDEQPTTQWVLFRVEPKEAVVTLDGQMLKTTDGTAQKMMPFGTYSWRVQAPDHLPDVGQVIVNDPDSTIKVKVRLKPNIAQVTLCADNNAEIWVNGELKGHGQWSGNLSTGVYVLEAKLTSHRSTRTEKQVDVVAGGDTIQLEAPTPIYGSADISSTPAVADIYIDGYKVGQTPRRITNLLIGQHHLRLSREGYADDCSTIEIKENQAVSYEATLLEGHLKALLAQQPVAQQPSKCKSLPAWAVEPQPDRWVGVSPPTADGLKGRRAAITAAILHYARSTQSGVLRQVVSASLENNQSDEQSMSLQKLDWADRYTYSGFVCQVEDEYYNADGEYFVLCNIQSGGGVNTQLRVERNCKDMEEDSDTNMTSSTSLSAVVTLAERGETVAKLGCDCLLDYVKKQCDYRLTSDNSYFATPDKMKYRVKSEGTAAVPSQTFSSAHLAASLGTVRLASLLFLPYVPDTLNVNGISETTDDGETTRYLSSCKLTVNGSCHATPATFSWTTEGLGMILSDVNLDVSTFQPLVLESDVVYTLSGQRHPIARLASMQVNMALAASQVAERNSAQGSYSNVSKPSSFSKSESTVSFTNVGVAWSSHSKEIPMRFGK